MQTLSPTAKNLEGKIAIITGGASGIGEATARLFTVHGARMIVIADIQDDLGQQVAKSIGTDNCTYMHCDVSNEDQVKALLDSTVRTYGQLDITFSNAGIVSASPQTVLDIDFTAFDRVFAVNARGIAAWVKHACGSSDDREGRKGKHRVHCQCYRQPWWCTNYRLLHVEGCGGWIG